MTKLFQHDVLDIKDKKILYCLCLNARFSINAIAKLTELSRDVVSYRIDKMVNDGILTYFCTLTNIWTIPLYRYHLFMKVKSLTKNEGEEIKKKLFKNKFVTWLARTKGEYEWCVGITVINKGEVNIKINEVLKIFNGNILDYHIFESINEKAFLEVNYALDEKGELEKIRNNAKKVRDRNSFFNELNNQVKDKNFKIDETDFKILKKLETNCRIGINEIAKELYISSSTVFNRIKKLAKNGIIKNFFPIISENKIGLTKSYVLLHTTISEKDKEIKFDRFIYENPFIVYRTKLVGDGDFYLEITHKNIEHYEIIMEEIKNLLGDDLVNYVHLSLLEEIKCEYLPEFILSSIKS